MSTSCLKVCADQLVLIFMQINKSQELCEVPSRFKHSTIILAPKKHSTTGLNDYSPMILMSVVVKSFEGLVLTDMKDIIGPLLDTCSLLIGKQVSQYGLSIRRYILQQLSSTET